MSNWQSDSLSFANHSHITTENDYEILKLTDVNLKKRWVTFFKFTAANAIHVNPLQFCSSMSLSGSPVPLFEFTVILIF